MFYLTWLKWTPNLLNMLSWYREVFMCLKVLAFCFFQKTQLALPPHTATSN